MTPGSLQRYAIFLSGYIFKIQFIISKNNYAGGLSRLPVDNEKNIYPEISYLHFVDDIKIMNSNLVKKETIKDPLLSKVKYYKMNGWPEILREKLEFYKQNKKLLNIEQDIIQWKHRIIIPNSLKNTILNELHQNHLGVTKMKSIARGHVWRPGIDKNIEDTARNWINFIILSRGMC